MWSGLMCVGLMKPCARKESEKHKKIMFGAGNFHHSTEEFGRRTLPPIKSASDKYFLESLGEYIQHEKERLMCPDKGPDEQRYIIYSSAFDKVST